jgi:predicted ABC-type exoprotein transport system permease subunit
MCKVVIQLHRSQIQAIAAGSDHSSTDTPDAMMTLTSSQAGDAAAPGSRQMHSQITGRALFVRRLVAFCKEQWRILRTAVDWVIAIYFIVPLLIAAGIIYTSWWQEPPVWFHWIPVPLLALVLFLWSLTFRLRTFLEPADQVFLLQNHRLVSAIRRWGFAYSCSVAVLAAALLYVVLSPLLVLGQGWSWPWIPVLALFTLASRLSVPIALELIQQRLQGIHKYTLQAAVLLTAGFLFISMFDLFARLRTVPYGLVHGMLLTGIASLTAWLIMRSRLSARGLFLHEVAQERRARLRLTAMLLSQSGTKEQRGVLEKRRPLIWRRSQPITKKRDRVSMLMAAFMKSYVRSSDQWFFLIRFLSVGSYALILTSGWVTLIVYPGLLYLLYRGIRSYCEMAMNRSYLDLFRWSESERNRAMEQAILRLSLPIALILLVIAVLT